MNKEGGFLQGVPTMFGYTAGEFTVHGGKRWKVQGFKNLDGGVHAVLSRGKGEIQVPLTTKRYLGA